MNKLPVLGKNPFELVAVDFCPEDEETIASAAYPVLNYTPQLLK